jgi:benzoate/toluate 1,2-dioxygenase reductase subunit
MNRALPAARVCHRASDDAMLNDGDVDIYLCGPPPMVNAVSGALRERGINPAGFWYEKFLASQSAAA